jgi:hypothetical protein
VNRIGQSVVDISIAHHVKKTSCKIRHFRACVWTVAALKFASRNVCWWRLWVVRSWRFENSGIFQASKRDRDVAAPSGMLFF